MSETIEQMRDRHYAEAMRRLGETEKAVAANPSYRAQVRMGDGKLIYVERHPELGIYVEVEERKEAPPAAYIVDQFNRTLPVSWELLRNGGDRISFAQAMDDPTERARLDAALLKAYPLDE